MKAITFKQYGGPEVLDIEDQNIPKPKDNEVLIKVYANSINKANILMIQVNHLVK